MGALPVGEGSDSQMGPFGEIAARFVRAAAGGRVADLPDLTCGLRVQRVLHAACESGRQGSAVSVRDG